MNAYALLKPSEKFIEGKWVFTGDSVVADDMCHRIDFLKKNILIKMATDASGWQVLYKDPGDGRYWELSYPDSGWHGGGAPALKCIDHDTAKREYGVI